MRFKKCRHTLLTLTKRRHFSVYIASLTSEQLSLNHTKSQLLLEREDAKDVLVDVVIQKVTTDAR